MGDIPPFGGIDIMIIKNSPPSTANTFYNIKISRPLVHNSLMLSGIKKEINDKSRFADCKTRFEKILHDNEAPKGNPEIKDMYSTI